MADIETYQAREEAAHQWLDRLGAPRADIANGYFLNVPGRLEKLAGIADLTKERVWEAEIVTDRDGNGPGDFVEHYVRDTGADDPEFTECGKSVAFYIEGDPDADSGWYVEHGFESHEYIRLCARCGVLRRLY